jgi:hypothetical protein
MFAPNVPNKFIIGNVGFRFFFWVRLELGQLQLE